MAFKIRRRRIYACLKIEFSNSKVSLLYFWKVKSFHLGMLIKEEKVKVAQNRLRHLINVRSTSFYKKETKNHSIYEMIWYLNLFYKNCSNMGISCQIMQVYHLHRIKKGAMAGRRSKIRARPFSKNWWMKQSEVWQVDGNCLMKLWISSVWAWSSVAAVGTNLNNLYPPEWELAATFFERKKAQIPFIVIKVALWEVNELPMLDWYGVG